MKKQAAVALSMCVLAAAAGAAAAGPIEDMAGYWSGAGTVLLMGGETERVKCVVVYKVGAGGTQIKQTLRCASADYNINGAAELRVQRSAGLRQLGGEDLLGHRRRVGPLHRQQLRAVDPGHQLHGGDERGPVELQAVDHHHTQGPRRAPYLHEPREVLTIAGAGCGALATPRPRSSGHPLIARQRFGTMHRGQGEEPSTLMRSPDADWHQRGFA